MVRYTLPITDHELDRVDAPASTHMARISEMIGAFIPLPEQMAFSSAHRVPREKYGDD